jgi:hypothetical protein
MVLSLSSSICKTSHNNNNKKRGSLESNEKEEEKKKNEGPSSVIENYFSIQPQHKQNGAAAFSVSEKRRS